MKCSILAAAAFAAALTFTQGAAALTWNEDDAGDVPVSAELTLGSLGSPLTSITGRLDVVPLLDNSFVYQVDLFGIRITDAANFRATASAGDEDTALFLFDADGFGVYSSEDTVDGLAAALTPYADLTNGFYYLGVAQGGFSARDGLGEDLFVQPASLTELAKGNPASGPLDSWLNGFSANADSSLAYSIALTGASVAAVPEPSAALMLALGLGGLAALRRRQRASGCRAG